MLFISAYAINKAMSVEETITVAALLESGNQQLQQHNTPTAVIFTHVAGGDTKLCTKLSQNFAKICLNF